LLFAHANGYPPGCYLPLVESLAARYRLLSIEQRPLWPGSRPEDLEDWHPLSRDLLEFLAEQRMPPVIAVGHSLGGIVCLRAALQQPGRFRALALLDPVLFLPRIVRTWNLVRTLGLAPRLHPLVRGAQRRRRTFESRERLFDLYRRKSVFRYFSDDHLRALVEGLTRPVDGKFDLAYNPEWESRIYLTGIWRDMDLWSNLKSLQVPLLIIRGAETDTFHAGAARLVQRRLPNARILTLDHSTHLVPLEKPALTAEAIFDFLEETL